LEEHIDWCILLVGELSFLLVVEFLKFGCVAIGKNIELGEENKVKFSFSN
jgi:hypothetical protein